MQNLYHISPLAQPLSLFLSLASSVSILFCLFILVIMSAEAAELNSGKK